jgi:hypothetical protein
MRLKRKVDSVCWEIVQILTQGRCTVLRRMYHRLRNSFGRTRWNTLVTWVMWNHVSVRLEEVLVSGQDRCIVCTKRTIGLENVFDVANGTFW